MNVDELRSSGVSQYFWFFQQTLSTWARVFYISAALNITTGTIFLVGGSSDPQPWREGTQSQHVYPMNTAAVTNPVYMKDNENAKTEENSTV